MNKKLSSLLICFVSLTIAISAADNSKHTLSEWHLGKTLFGEKVSDRDMKGKVVVIEHWGVNCPPCIALLPHMVRMDKRYRSDGLLIIGAESQNHSKADIEPLVKKNKIKYTITQNARGPINFNMIPRAFVFDVEGNLVFNGDPQDDNFERSIKKALKDVEKAGEESSSFATSSNLFETKTWSNSEGKEMRAAVKEASDTEVTFVMFDRKIVKYPLAKLSEESRKEIEDALAAKNAK